MDKVTGSHVQLDDQEIIKEINSVQPSSSSWMRVNWVRLNTHEKVANRSSCWQADLSIPPSDEPSGRDLSRQPWPHRWRQNVLSRPSKESPTFEIKSEEKWNAAIKNKTKKLPHWVKLRHQDQEILWWDHHFC